MATPGTGQVLALRIEGERFGVPARLVREVARLPLLTRVPHAPDAMIGLANVRGVVMPVLSLAQLLGRRPGVERRLVVMEGNEPVGLAVDSVAELVDDGSLDVIDAATLVSKTLSCGIERIRATAGTATEVVAETVAKTLSIVTFTVADQGYALALDTVEEVLRMPENIAVLPHADPAVLGSIDLRGSLLPVLSLAELLALPDRGVSSRTRILVVRVGEHRVGLAVDAMQSILRVAEEDIDPVPVVLSRGNAETRVQAICRVGGSKLVSVLASQYLLREDITAQLGSSSARDVAKAELEYSEQFLLFRVGDLDFGLPIASVEEVAMLPAKLTRLPRSPGFVRGVMNFRGAAVPIIDQAKRFGAPAGSGSKQRVLVVKVEGIRAGFLVDSVAEIRRIARAALRPAPELGGSETHVFDQVATGDEDQGIVLILGPRELLDRAESDMLRAMPAKGAVRS